GTGEDREAALAEGALGEPDDGVVLVHLAAGQLVRLGDPDQLEHTGEDLEGPGIDRRGGPRGPDPRPRGARHGVRRHAHTPDRLRGPVGLVRCRMGLHHGEHCWFFPARWRDRRPGNPPHRSYRVDAISTSTPGIWRRSGFP